MFHSQLGTAGCETNTSTGAVQEFNRRKKDQVVELHLSNTFQHREGEINILLERSE